MQYIPLDRKTRDTLAQLIAELDLEPPKVVKAALSFLNNNLDTYRRVQAVRKLVRTLFKPAPGALKILKCHVDDVGGQVVIKRRAKLTIHEHIYLENLAEVLADKAEVEGFDLLIDFSPPLGEPDYPLHDGLTSSVVSDRIIKATNGFMKKLGADSWDCRVFWRGDYENDGVYPELVVVTSCANPQREGQLRSFLYRKAEAIGWHVDSVIMTTAFQGNGSVRMYAVSR